MNDEGLRHLTTATLQKLVCAALNCRKLLKLVFGVTPDGKVLGALHFQAKCVFTGESPWFLRKRIYLLHLFLVGYFLCSVYLLLELYETWLFATFELFPSVVLVPFLFQISLVFLDSWRLCEWRGARLDQAGSGLCDVSGIPSRARSRCLSSRIPARLEHVSSARRRLLPRSIHAQFHL